MEGITAKCSSEEGGRQRGWKPNPEVIGEPPATLVPKPPCSAIGNLLVSNMDLHDVYNCDNSCIDNKSIQVHDDCELMPRDLMQLPAAALAHRHVCEASHTANVQNKINSNESEFDAHESDSDHHKDVEEDDTAWSI